MKSIKKTHMDIGSNVNITVMEKKSIGKTQMDIGKKENTI